jgi:phage terminase large subunit-like protein
VSLPDYAGIARQYCLDVTEGRIPACQYVHRATQRHLDDLGRQSAPAFPYAFSPALAGRVCAFVERLSHVKGDLAGQLIKLLPFQVFILSTIFGWIHDRGDKMGKRRFRRVFIELPRGNAKSTLSSAVALYMLSADNEGGADCYSAATTRDQARIVWADAAAMARSPVSRQMMTKLGVSAHAHTINVQTTNSKFIPLSAEGSSLEGLSVHFGVIDEIHAHRTREVWDSIVLGAGKRSQSIVWGITTAGYDMAGIGFEQHTYTTKILDGVVTDESTFGIIYSIDPGDDWQSPENWRKANPAWKVAVDPEYFESIANEAIAVSSKQPGFQTKYLNLWLSSSHSWADLPSWQRCIDPSIKIKDFHKKPVFIGLDLASKTDMAAKVILAPMDNGHYAAFPTYYLPDKAVTDGRNSQYKGWFIDGRIRTTEGEVLDFDVIEADILADMKTFDVQEVAIDPYEARQLMQRLMAQSVPVIEIGQTVGNLSEPTKELDAMTRSGKLHYDCPILLWMASNVIVRVDTNDNIKANKAKPEDKIDGVIALILALCRAMLHQSTGHGILIDFI